MSHGARKKFIEERRKDLTHADCTLWMHTSTDTCTQMNGLWFTSWHSLTPTVSHLWRLHVMAAPCRQKGLHLVILSFSFYFLFWLNKIEWKNVFIQSEWNSICSTYHSLPDSQLSHARTCSHACPLIKWSGLYRQMSSWTKTKPACLKITSS